MADPDHKKLINALAEQLFEEHTPIVPATREEILKTYDFTLNCLSLGDNGEWAGFVNSPKDIKIYMTTTRAGLHTTWHTAVNLGIGDAPKRLQKKYEEISGNKDNAYEKILNFVNACKHSKRGMFGYTELPELEPERITTLSTSYALESLRYILPLVPEKTRNMITDDLTKNSKKIVKFLKECSYNGGFDVTPKSFTKYFFTSLWGTYLALNTVDYFQQLTNTDIYHQIPAFKKTPDYLKRCQDKNTGAFYAYPIQPPKK